MLFFLLPSFIKAQEWSRNYFFFITLLYNNKKYLKKNNFETIVKVLFFSLLNENN